MPFMRTMKLFLIQLKTPFGILILSSLIHVTFRPVSSESNWLDYLHLLITFGVAIYVGKLTSKQSDVTYRMSFLVGVLVWIISSTIGFCEILFNYLTDIQEIKGNVNLVLQGYLLGNLMLAPFLGLISMLSAIVARKYKL